MLLVATLVTIPPPSEETGGGPLFPPPSSTRSFNSALVHLINTSTTPDRFDELKDSDRNLLNEFIKTSVFMKLKSTIYKGSLSTKNEDSNVSYLVRKYRDYFFAQSVVLKSSGKDKAGEVFANCYFFKKVN